MRRVPAPARLSVFLRAFLIQGSWNYRTMLGGGVAFALLPVLRRLYRDSPERLRERLSLHLEHFNAHPYLANLALGAIARMEAEGRSEEEIRRFKLAVRGPLGGLGDALIWVGWRPAVVLAALALALLGATPAVTVVFFLLLYNTGHLLVRGWGFRLGLRSGSRIGEALRYLSLPRQADRLASVGVFFLGAVTGLALWRSWTYGGASLALPVSVACIWGFWLGSLIGHRGWRWTLWGIMGLIAVITVAGWVL